MIPLVLDAPRLDESAIWQRRQYDQAVQRLIGLVRSTLEEIERTAAEPLTFPRPGDAANAIRRPASRQASAISSALTTLLFNAGIQRVAESAALLDATMLAREGLTDLKARYPDIGARLTESETLAAEARLTRALAERTAQADKDAVRCTARVPNPLGDGFHRCARRAIERPDGTRFFCAQHGSRAARRKAEQRG